MRTTQNLVVVCSANGIAVWGSGASVNPGPECCDCFLKVYFRRILSAKTLYHRELPAQFLTHCLVNTGGVGLYQCVDIVSVLMSFALLFK